MCLEFRKDVEIVGGGERLDGQGCEAFRKAGKAHLQTCGGADDVVDVLYV